MIAVQNNPNLGYDLTRDSIGKLVAAYKEDIKRNYNL